jgi:hypothetical protein
MAEPIFMNVFRGTKAHLNGVLHKSLPSGSVYVFLPVVAMQRLRKNVTTATNTHATVEELLDESFSMASMSYQGMQAVSSSQKVLYKLDNRSNFRNVF